MDADVLVALAQACDGHERVVVDYSDREERRSERRLEPHRLVSTGRRWYLVALDLDRRDWRTFRVDRIAGARRTGHRFVPDPDAPDAATLVSEGVSTAPYRHHAVVRFPATSADELGRRIPPTVGTIRADAGRGRGRRSGCVLTTGGDHLDLLAGHLVGLGLEFEVVEPPELRHHLSEVVARLQRATTA